MYYVDSYQTRLVFFLRSANSDVSHELSLLLLFPCRYNSFFLMFVMCHTLLLVNKHAIVIGAIYGFFVIGCSFCQRMTSLSLQYRLGAKLLGKHYPVLGGVGVDLVVSHMFCLRVVDITPTLCKMCEVKLHHG